MVSKTKINKVKPEDKDRSINIEVINRRLTALEKKLGVMSIKEHVRDNDKNLGVERRIEDLELFISGRTVLGYYDKVFEGCKPCALTDIDGTIERRGFFLFLEMKASGASWSIPLGQKIYFDRLAKYEKIAVIIRWGDVGKTERVQVHGVHRYAEPCTEEMFVDLLKGWWNSANNKTEPDMKQIWNGIIQKSQIVSKPKSLYS